MKKGINSIYILMKPELVRDNIPLIMIQEGKKAFIKDIFTYSSYLLDYRDIRHNFAWNKLNDDFKMFDYVRTHDEKVVVLANIVELLECFFEPKIMEDIDSSLPNIMVKRIQKEMLSNNISKSELVQVKAAQRLEKGSYKKEYILIDIYES